LLSSTKLRIHCCTASMRCAGSVIVHPAKNYLNVSNSVSLWPCQFVMPPPFPCPCPPSRSCLVRWMFAGEIPKPVFTLCFMEWVVMDWHFAACAEHPHLLFVIAVTLPCILSKQPLASTSSNAVCFLMILLYSDVYCIRARSSWQFRPLRPP